MIWEDIVSAGWCPLEIQFEHYFHNPLNSKFDFVDSSVRNCKPDLAVLFGLIQKSGIFIGGTSGPFHVALSCLPPERVVYLERDFPKDRYTYLPIKTVKLNSYNHEIKKWLNML